MSFVVVASVLLQAGAAALVVATMRWRAFGLVGAAFVLVSVAYHAGAEIVRVAIPVHHKYRDFVTQDQVDDWLWIVSVAILIFAAVYVVVVGRSWSWPRAPTQLSLPSWPILLALTIPLYVAALSGRGSSDSSYWLGGLTAQFLVLAVALTSVAFLRARGGRHVVPVLVAQAVVLAPVGSRWSIVAGGALTVWALVRLGMTPRRADVLAVVGLAVLAGAVISSARVVAIETRQEHFSLGTQETARSRVTLVARGVIQLPVSLTREAFWSDWVYRIDGNALPALSRDAQTELQTRSLGVNRLAEAPLIAVPSFAYPGKSELGDGLLDEKERLVRQFAVTRRADFLNPTFGMLYAYVGVVGLWLAAALLGTAFALVDRWLVSRLTASRLVIGMGLLLCVLLYEQGVQVYPLTLRGILAIVVAIKVAELASARIAPMMRDRGSAASAARRRVSRSP